MLSSIMIEFLAVGRCPLCGSRVLTGPADVSAEEVERAPARVLAPFMPRPATIEFLADGMPQCTSCHGIWPLNHAQEQVLVEAAADEDGDSEPTVDLRETGRAEDVVKVEQSLCDNRGSPASVTRTLAFTHTIERSTVVETTRAVTAGGNAGGNLLAAQLQAKIEASIARKYSITGRETITVSNTVAVEVPADVAVRVVVRWIREWQEGEASVAAGVPADKVIVPYRLPAGLRLDVQTVRL